MRRVWGMKLALDIFWFCGPARLLWTDLALSWFWRGLKCFY